MLAEMRDTVGLIMLEQGVDISGRVQRRPVQTGLDVLAGADRQRPDPQGQGQLVQGRPQVSGDTLAVIGWSGDIFRSTPRTDDKWGSRSPRPAARSGATTCSCPNGSPHQANAEKRIDYYYEPEVAAKLAAWVNYICPVEGAQEEMEKIDPDLVDNQLIFPDEETLVETRQDFRSAHDRPGAELRRRVPMSQVADGRTGSGVREARTATCASRT